MIINLVRLEPKGIVPVKAHKVLEKHYPKLKLYAHYTLQFEGSKKRRLYSISTESGFAVNGRSCERLKYAVSNAITKINYLGEDRVLEAEKERQQYCKVNNWGGE